MNTQPHIAHVAIIQDDARAPKKRTLKMRSSGKRRSSAFVNEFFSFPCFANELSKQREAFLAFLRILLKYLELHDHTRYQMVKRVLRKFATLYREGQSVNGGPQEGTLLLDMYDQVKACVTKQQWQAARHYLRSFLIQRRQHRIVTHQQAIVSTDGS